MVMLVHTCEPFYFDAAGNTFFQSKDAAFWASWLDSLVHCCVPLFVMASSYLLFPVTRPTGEFFKRRLVRVFVPYVVWLCIYTAAWGEWGKLPFNFPFELGRDRPHERAIFQGFCAPRPPATPPKADLPAMPPTPCTFAVRGETQEGCEAFVRI